MRYDFNNLGTLNQEIAELDRMNRMKLGRKVHFVNVNFGTHTYDELSHKFFTGFRSDYLLFTTTTYCFDYDLAIKTLDRFIDNKLLRNRI
jgi:hypothetical protein